MNPIHPWLGAVASNIRMGRLKHGLSALQSGGTPESGNPAFWSDGGTPWVAISDMSKTERVVETGKCVTDAGLADKRLSVLEPGTLLYSMYASLGHVSELAIPATTNQAILGLSFVEGVCRRYAFWQLKAVQPYVAVAASSSTQDNLNAEKVRNMPFAFPPLFEQERIANFLDEQTARIDALISEKQRLLERLTEYAHSVSDDLFRRRVSECGDVQLKYRCPNVTVGIVVTPAKYYVQTGVPCLRSLNVGEGFIVPKNLVYISPESNELHRKSKIFAGDLVVVRSGKPGAVAVVPVEFDGANCIDLVIIRSSPAINSKWLRAYLNSAPAMEQVSDASEGAIQQHFNVGSARELRIPDVPQHTQEIDVAYIENVEQSTAELKRHVEQHIERLQEYRASLISAAVTGQVDINSYKEAA